LELWALNRLTALFAADTDVPAVLGGVADALGEPLPLHAIETVPDADWVRQTQAQYAPIEVAERLWIVPSWCDPVDPEAINISLDPGLAFGTGSHATTRLCLRWLAANLNPGEAILDYGCGSGILAIAAARLGAKNIAGIDVDPQAIMASRANAERNYVAARFGLPEQLSTFVADIVIANILANPLRMLAPLLAAHVRVGGSIVLSGILETQADQVAACYRRWFNIGIWGQEDRWVALAGRRKAHRTKADD
jgi:ribosomal protein L11 methyltransferase